MNPYPFIIAAYAIAVLVPASFGLAAHIRMRRAERRLRAVDPRTHRRRGAGKHP